MTDDLSPELRLVAACCIWQPSARRDEAIKLVGAVPLNWDEVLRLVFRHRVAGLVHNSLSQSGLVVPARAKSQIAAAASDTAREALMMGAEALRIRAAFDAAGIPNLNLKGSALAVLAYGSLAIKHAWDIDTLVPPECVGRAVRVLHELGYERRSPPSDLSEAQFLVWTQFAHEAIFRNAKYSIAVELHWRLTDNMALEIAPGFSDAGQWVEVGGPGRKLRTLSDEQLFSYLCLHGTHHAWGRLKWLADVAAWLGQKTPDQILNLYRCAQRVGAQRAAEQALVLCRELFGFELPNALSDGIGQDRISRWLVSVALDTITGPETEMEGSLKIALSQFLLASNLRQAWWTFETRLIGWTDFMRLRLPRPFFFLYPVIRLPSWVWRRVWRAGARRA
ncbi:MAG: nucleotidyltransferase family protein [Alphaproteobacteria bacterium]|nr:nucleotidyltransferase family protein [Alphaproteobacteria bacterium]MBL7099807.1 nucleotidyltransferase family protein [Alphaproteobacteria bacterium]